MSIIEDILNWVQRQNPETVKAWGPILVGLAAIVVGLIINIVLVLTQRSQNRRQNAFNERQLSLSKSKEERDDILKQLNTFYGPFIELRTQSKLLYSKFEDELTKKSAGTGKRFRTLRHLLEGKTFTPQEETLLMQILEINKELLKLIVSSSGVVDKLELQDLLGKFGAHSRILQLAYEKKLNGPPELFEDIVFPLAVDGAVQSAIQRLKYRLEELDDIIEGHHPTKSKEKRNSTLEYYDKNADQYLNKTLFLDLSELYKEFEANVTKRGRILDAGCGVGRDTRYFIEQGYTVISFDASKEMARKCNEYPHAFCLNISFEDLKFREEFDGVWCCGSLLHLTLEGGKGAIRRLTTSLKVGGIMFVSLKEGEGKEKSEGRFFQYYNESSVKELYKGDSRLEVVKMWATKSSVPEEKHNWLSLLLQRK
jgi:hypothetical protein